MDKRLRTLLEERGLSPTANEQEAQEFYAAIPTEEKGRIGVELAQQGYDAAGPVDEPLTVREAVDAPPQDLTTRGFVVRAESVDEDARSVEAAIATEQPVTVYDWRSDKIIDEVLRMDGMQTPDQVPMLANHSRWSLDDVYGSVREITTTRSAATARLFFAEGDEDAERAWNKVRGGHLRDVSVGYRADKYTDIRPGQSAVVGGKTYRAKDRTLRVTSRWTLREVSLVPIGADSRSKIRGDLPLGSKPMPKELREYLESIGLRTDADEAEAKEFLDGLTGKQAKRAAAIQAEIDKRNAPPDDDPPADDPPADNQRAANNQRTANPPEPPEPPTDPQEIARQAIADERQRVRALQELAGDDVPAETLQRAIDEGLSTERAAPLFLTAVRTREPGPAIHSRVHDRDCNVRSLAAGLLISQGLDPTEHALHRGQHTPLRQDALTEQDADLGDRFARMSAVDVCRECVRMDGGRVSHDYEETIRTAVSGATLSSVFSTNVYARLLAGWETVGDTTAGWCDEEDVANFLQQEDISMEANARLERLPRGDTAKHATASDSAETYQIARYAKQFVIDEQDIIDDRLGALMRMPSEMGENARQLRPDMVYSIMLQNPTMTDTGAVFNATAVTTAGGHANLGTAALSADALGAAIRAMVAQRIGRTSTNPGRALNIRAKFLIVPGDLEWTARVLTASAELAKLFADSSDPWYSMLNLIAKEGIRVVPDARIDAVGVLDPRTGAARTGSATNWFLTAGGSRGLRVAYRRGTNRQPSMRSFALDRGQWGIGWDINMDIGVAFTEWRTWYKSTGAGA